MQLPFISNKTIQVSPEIALIQKQINEEEKEWRKALGKWVFSAVAPLTTAFISGPIALIQIAQWWGNESQLKLAQANQVLYTRNSLLTEVNNDMNLWCGAGSGALAVGALCLFGFKAIANRPDASKILKTELPLENSEQEHITDSAILEANVNMTKPELLQRAAARDRGDQWPPTITQTIPAQ